MFIPVGILLTLTFTTNVANGQKTTFQAIDMAEAKPYDKIECPRECGSALNFGLNVISVVLETFLQRIPIPNEMCHTCFMEGLYGFSFTRKCYMSPEKDVFDHYLDLTFPNYVVKCDCDLSNNPSEAASKANRGKALVGQCGKDKLKNTEDYKPITCEGGQGGDGQSHVRLKGDLTNSSISTILRIDARSNRIDAFPIRLSLTTMTSAPISYEGPPEFEESWNCLSSHMDALFLHLYGNSSTAFFDCLEPGKPASLVHTILTLFGQC